MNERLKVERQEIKYEIDYSVATELYARLSKIMVKDRHDNNDGYLVRSLYFDSLNCVDYEEKMHGLESRKKIRLRVYDIDQTWSKLEMKIKENNFQTKHSMILNRDESLKIINGDYSILIDKNTDVAYKFYKTMTMGMYIPRVLIEYKRHALSLDVFNTRITFDTDIRCGEYCRDLFSETVLHPVLNDKVILEIKFNGNLDVNIKNILDSFSLNRISYSKYCNSIIFG